MNKELNRPIVTKIDPTEFDLSICALLTSLDAEKYIEVFRKKNIGQLTLAEFTEEDLIKTGVDDENIRKKILEEIKNLPIYSKSSKYLANHNAILNPKKILNIIEESSEHLYRIYLSMLANTLALKKTKNIPDCLLYQDKYASDITMSTLSEINNILNSMEIALHTQVKVKTAEFKKKRNKKIIVGSFGSVAIAVLAVLFVNSLKQLRITI